jgi:thiamine-phosphate pyrophosphorylase
VNDVTNSPGEAPHFTKEMLLDAMRHLRADFEASVSGVGSGEGSDERARSRLEHARRLGLDKIATESIAAIDQATLDVSSLIWPGGLDGRYLGLVSAIEALAAVSTSLIPHDAEHAHLTDLATAMATAMLAAGSGHRHRMAGQLAGVSAIVDPELTNGRDPVWVAAEALAGGASAIQLVDHRQDRGGALDLATRIAELCGAEGVPLFIHGHPDMAVAVGAAGVHLGPPDLPLPATRRVLRPWQAAGTSNASLAEAEAAWKAGADYVALGRMFATGPGSDVGVPGPETVRELRGLLPGEGAPAVIAVGGITAANAGLVAAAGADGICAMAAITQAGDPRAATARLVETFEKGR